MKHEWLGGALIGFGCWAKFWIMAVWKIDDGRIVLCVWPTSLTKPYGLYGSKAEWPMWKMNNGIWKNWAGIVGIVAHLFVSLLGGLIC